MKNFLSFLRIFTVFCALFLFIVSLVMIYGFVNGNIATPKFALFAFVVLLILGALVFFNLFYSKFAHSINLQNGEIVFNFKRNQIAFNRADCTKIWTNGYITRFVFSDKILWCFNKHYLPSNETEKLADIINDEFFKNAVIKKILA